MRTWLCAVYLLNRVFIPANEINVSFPIEVSFERRPTMLMKCNVQITDSIFFLLLLILSTIIAYA